MAIIKVPRKVLPWIPIDTQARAALSVARDNPFNAEVFWDPRLVSPELIEMVRTSTEGFPIKTMTLKSKTPTKCDSG